MFDISDFYEWAHEDCVFDIYDLDTDKLLVKNGQAFDVKTWINTNTYWFESFEPIQDGRFGIQFNVSHVEKIINVEYHLIAHTKDEEETKIVYKSHDYSDVCDVRDDMRKNNNLFGNLDTWYEIKEVKVE